MTCFFSRSRDKLEWSYLHSYSAYGHQTWLDGDFPWVASTQNFIRSSGHVVLRGHVTN